MKIKLTKEQVIGTELKEGQEIEISTSLTSMSEEVTGYTYLSNVKGVTYGILDGKEIEDLTEKEAFELGRGITMALAQDFYLMDSHGENMLIDRKFFEGMANGAS